MKFLKKINKGLILTIIVLVILITYLIIQEIQRGEEKEDIIQECKEYIAFIDKYSVLPEEYQTLKPTISEEEFNKYLSDFKEEIKQYTIANENVLDIQYKVIESNLQDLEMTGISVTTKFSREIKKIKKYEFDGNQVTVTFESDVEKNIKSKNISTDEETIETKEFTTNEDSISLQKEDGKWKIVYANLQMSSDNDTENYYSDSTVVF